MSLRVRASAVASLSLATLVAPLVAPEVRAAESPLTQCEAAYEGVQLLRQRGKLVSAREQAAVCARDVCPELARRDCVRWTEELSVEVPTVVVVARDEMDREVAGSRLVVDGVPHPELASGRAFELDPGSHSFRVERTNGPPVEQPFTVYQGERGRVLRIVIPGAPPPSPRAWVSREIPPPPVLRAADGHSVLPAVVVGGLSLAVLATSGFLGLTGRQQLSDLRSSCAPACTGDQVTPVRTRLVASDVALGVGLVGAAVAVSLFTLRGRF